MSDLISRKALIERFSKLKGSDTLANMFVSDVIREIKNQPPVEAVPVVHCKNCKHWGTGVAGETEHVKCCEYGKYMVGENGYCVYGEQI